jgi:2'-5' RNA ligase
MRAFVSIDFPESLTEAVADVQSAFADAEGLRTTDPGQTHVTLKFLGEVETDRVPAVEDAVEDAVDAAGVEPFEATVGGLGVFPSMEYISVVWLGFRSGGPELTRLFEAIERETTAIGFESESHEFTPHATIARMDDARGKELVQRVVREQDPTVGSFRVESIRLKESTLTPDGPVYDTVSRFSL